VTADSKYSKYWPLVRKQACRCILYSMTAVLTTLCSRLQPVTSWVHRHS